MSEIRTALRTLFGRLVGPIWRRAWLRVEHRLTPVEQRLATLEQRLGAVEASSGALFPHADAIADAVTGWGNRIIAAEARQDEIATRLASLEGAWRQNVPAFLNGVGTVSALAHALAEQGRRIDGTDETTRALQERLEFTRQEILFEMAHGPARTEGAAPGKVAARIVDPARIDACRRESGLRLNLGAGHIARPGYVNVDRRALPGIDVVAEADDLPFQPGTVDEIASAHLMEHMPNEAMRRRYLPHWLTLLRPGGVFRAITPDGQAMLAAAAAGTYGFAEFREVLFGAQDYDGDYHYNLFTPDSLAALLREAGLTDIEVPVSGRRNGKCFEFEIVARRP